MIYDILLVVGGAVIGLVGGIVAIDYAIARAICMR